jgi:hypothetical protein
VDKMRTPLPLFPAPTLLQKQAQILDMFLRLVGAKNPSQIRSHFIQAPL